MLPIKPLSEDSFRRTEAVVLAYERGAGGVPSARGGKRHEGGRAPIRGILLDDLPSDGTADGAVSEFIETTEVQEVALLGNPTGGTFTLKFQSQTTPVISWQATAEELQSTLENLETIGKGNVSVALGQTSTKKPGVWLVTFTGKFIGVDVPLFEPADSLTGASLVVAATTHWADSGRIESVRDVIPVGIPTPLRAGAVFIAIWFFGVGYGLIAAECRDFDPYYL